MSGVSLRCPNCGTTRATPGACDACHEADVRYFCSNHSPGIWLDAAKCPQCGARFGDAAAAPTPPGRAAHRPAHGAAETTRARPEEVRRPPATLEEVLREAARARRSREELLPAPPPARGRSGFGCLLRVVMMLLILFVAGYAGLLMLASSFFRVF